MTEVNFNPYNSVKLRTENGKDYSQNKSVMLKISNFLKMKNITINEFWQTNNNYASASDLKHFCILSGLRLNIQDEIDLKNQLFNEKEVISIYQFCQLVEHWKDNGRDLILNFLKERSEMLIQNVRAKDNNRIKSNHNKTTSHSTNLRKSSSAVKNRKQTFIRNNSKSYLYKHKQNQRKIELKLYETIDKNKNQYEYAILHKMNEANQICKNTNSHITFRVYKNAQGNLKVRIFNLNNLQKEINLQQFQRQFKSIKHKNKENKEWKTKQIIQKGIKVENERLILKPKKEERQLELRNLLAQTVNLTNLLKEQIKILNIKGIYGSEDS